MVGVYQKNLRTNYMVNGIVWSAYDVFHTEMRDLLGYLPDFVHIQDLRPAAAQIHQRYTWGGWMKMDGFTYDPGTHVLTYPGDPPLKPLASAWMRDELIMLYRSSMVAVVQKDGSFEVARIS